MTIGRNMLLFLLAERCCIENCKKNISSLVRKANKLFKKPLTKEEINSIISLYK